MFYRTQQQITSRCHLTYYKFTISYSALADISTSAQRGSVSSDFNRASQAVTETSVARRFVYKTDRPEVLFRTENTDDEDDRLSTSVVLLQRVSFGSSTPRFNFLKFFSFISKKQTGMLSVSVM